MKITKRQLRKIIREAVESEYYKNLKQRSAHKGEITRSVKSFSKIVIDQVENLLTGIDVPFTSLEKRHQAFILLNNEIRYYLEDIEKEYDKKIRQPEYKREAEKNRKWNDSNLNISEDELSDESEKFLQDFD